MDKNRESALKVILEVENKNAYSNLALNKELGDNSQLNKPFVREIVYGVLRNKKLLDYYISQFLTQPINKLKPCELNILRMSIYQIKYMNSVPNYAACSEGVSLAKKYARGKDKFVNAVLRNYLKKGETIEEPASWEIRFSIENRIIQLIKSAYGSEETEKILESFNKVPKLTIRVNVNKINKEELKKILEAKGFTVEYNPMTNRGLWVKGGSLTELPEYKEGLFAIQDTASIIVADKLNPNEKQRVLDLCAAPGGKTFALSELMHNKGEIIAIDKYQHKIDLMERKIIERNIKNVKVMVKNSEEYEAKFKEAFDLVLADVPCSGLGVIGSKPEMKYRDEDNFSQLVQIQRNILKNGACYVKKGGILVYSTCTINPEENHNQIENFLRENAEYELLEENKYFPYMDMDGFFICKMKRKED